MRRNVMTWCRFFAIAFAAVCLMDGTALLASDCPETKPAVERGPIAPNGPWIAYQCPEACSNWKYPPLFSRYEEDPWLLDRIWVWCEDPFGGPGWEHDIASTSDCWHCMDGCAGADCPEGEICAPRPRTPGSDCRRYGCDDPAYMVVENFQTGVPECRRKDPCPSTPPPPSCVPATVYLNGPTAIPPGGTCTWSAAASSACTGATYTYNWYIEGYHYVGSGEYYSGGRPNGVLIGYPWRLRVEALYNGVVAGSQEIEVRESSTARFCLN